MLMAALVVSVAATATASAALPAFEPASGTLTVKSGKGLLETKSGSTIKCTSDKGSGKITSATHGTFEVTFEGCKSTGFIEASCKGLSNESEKISTKGTFLLRRSESKAAVILFEPEPTHITCSIILIVVTGRLACSISPVNTLVKTTEHYTVTCAKGAGKGENAITKVSNEAETGFESAVLSSEQNENGKPEQSSEETTEEVSSSVESKIKS
jgi:hypothetical protein